MRPLFVQQSSNEIEPDLVATEIGSGGIDTTSTSRLNTPVIHMFAPPSIRDGLSIASMGMAARVTLAYDCSSPLRLNTLGSPTTLVTLSIVSSFGT
jgi:hypothetical protein